MLSHHNRYDRIGNILYENDVPKFKFTKSKFIDVINLKPNVIDYMNRYMEMWPNNWEKITEETMYDIIKLFYDLETTGVKAHQNGIHHLSALLEINDEVVAELDLRMQPNPKAIIEPSALAISNTTMEDIESFMPMEEAYRRFEKFVGKYVDRFNKKSKMYLVGFNNRKFDDVFLRKWFEQNGNDFFGSYFWSDSLDVMVLASQYLIGRRIEMPSFKLHRVAKELGIVVDDSGLHDAKYDLELTREIYRIVTGIDIEL